MARRIRSTCPRGKRSRLRTRTARGCDSRRALPNWRRTTASSSCGRWPARRTKAGRGGPRHPRRPDVIERHRRPLSTADDWIAEQADGLWEGWMRQVDQVLADAQLVQLVYEVLARRWTHSLTRGRKGTPAEVVLRLLLLKHMRNWSYAVLEREVRANLVYRQFTRVGAQKVPDAKTLGRLAIALGPEVIE